MAAGLYVNSPVGTPVRMNVSATDMNLTTVLTAAFSVERTDKSEALWECVITNATPTSLSLTYAIQAGDLPIVGHYRVFAILTGPSGTRHTEVKIMPVLPKYGLAA